MDGSEMLLHLPDGSFSFLAHSEIGLDSEDITAVGAQLVFSPSQFTGVSRRDCDLGSSPYQFMGN
jgi:hypothetical protein